MYIHQQPSTPENLARSLKQARETEFPFILDLSTLPTLPSKSIRELVETHSFRKKGLYILLPSSNAKLFETFQRESLLGVLPFFNRMKDIEKVIFQKGTPCYVGSFPGKFFTLGADAIEDLNQAMEAYKRTGDGGLSWALRDAFQKEGVTIPARVTVLKENEDWLICEYKEKKSTPTEKSKVLYLIRPDVYGKSLEVCYKMLTLSLYGSLCGEENATRFYELLKNETSPILFLDLNQCYSWDANYAAAFQKAKECKKIYLIRADVNNVDLLFKVPGEIFYCDYEKAYEKANLILQKRWEISIPEKKKMTPLIEISGYLEDQKEEWLRFRKSLFEAFKKNLREFHWVCLDIRELYRMETKARRAFLHALQKWMKKYKMKSFHILIVATLPRPDYIVHDVVSDLYAEGFFVVASLEDAQALHSSYPYPHFFIENSIHGSMLKLEGNILRNQERKIFAAVSRNLMQNSLSFASDSSNILKSPQGVVFFDFLNVPCVSLPVLESLTGMEHEKVIKILLAHKHFQELVKKNISKQSSVWCYDRLEEALAKHVCNVLIVLPLSLKKKAKIYFKGLFEEIYQTKEAKNTRFCIRFECSVERLPSVLHRENYRLILLYGYAQDAQYERVCHLLQRAGKNILEFKPLENQSLEFSPTQLEMQASPAIIKKKIMEALWEKNKLQTSEYRFVFWGRDWGQLSEKIFQYSKEEERALLTQFLPPVDESQYEMTLTYDADNSLVAALDKDTVLQQSFSRMEMHPYKQWSRNFTYSSSSSLIELMQKTANESDIGNTFALLEKYTQFPTKIWEIVPNKIKKCNDYRWISFLAHQKKFLASIFKSKLFEIQYVVLLLHREMDEIFLGTLGTLLSALKDEIQSDLRYQGLELPLSSVLKTMYRFTNKENPKNNAAWIMASIEFLENEGLEIVINMENLSLISDFPPEVRKDLEDVKALYKVDLELAMGKENTLFQIQLFLKKLNKRVITFKKE